MIDFQRFGADFEGALLARRRRSFAPWPLNTRGPLRGEGETGDRGRGISFLVRINETPKKGSGVVLIGRILPPNASPLLPYKERSWVFGPACLVSYWIN